ncbi:MAG: CinA family protein [Alphaproteobacteria bacterium]
MDLAARAAGVAAVLKEKKWTVSVAESSAGGLISAALLAVPGASAYYVGGGVIYTRHVRRALLGLTDDAIKARGSTEAYALLLAQTMRQKLDTTWAVGETGAAGPTGTRYGHPPGYSCIAVTGPVERVITLETGSADREANMWRFADAAFELFRKAMAEAG